MTLIIGIKCKEGIVVGADSAATLISTLSTPTVIQHVPKLDIKEEMVIIGTSGSIGISQLVGEELDEQWKDILDERKKGEVRNKISHHFWKQIEPHVKKAKVFADILGPQLALLNSTIKAVVALPIQDKPVLLQFDEQIVSEEAIDIPFFAIGSGQAQADPFLAFLKRFLWNNEIPSKIADCLLATIWTLDHVISVNPGGVGGDIQVYILQKNKGEWAAKRLSKERIDYHLENIEGCKEALTNYFDPLIGE